MPSSRPQERNENAAPALAGKLQDHALHMVAAHNR